MSKDTSSSTESEVRSGNGKVEAQKDKLTQLVLISEDAVDTNNEAVNPTLNPDSSMKSDTYHTVESFCVNWILHLERDDRVSLGLAFSELSTCKTAKSQKDKSC